ncbi:peptide methionine sulfoxide reductase-like [Mytilus edulis]|uniref:peptide methionine sulfoxide reductase-like n=1 Tax=Mytilus edulis TaxID=6550 RepID=UPI0039F012E9
MSAIFYHNTKQKIEAEESKKEQQKEMVRPIVTQIKKADTFYDAEDYHQKYQLRKYHEILDSLNLTNEELITSPVASRLNGYLGGYGSAKAFEEECEDLGLPQKVRSLVSSKLQNKL